jgi:predicted ATPase/DNA-binding CsgD family transcriptional regulator
VLSATTSDLVIDQLPADGWLSDLGSHPLRDLPRPERVVQLCHPDLCNDFPPLRVPSTTLAHNLPVQLTNFVGRQAEMASLREALVGSRLVTLTGAGGVGKTRLSVHVATQIANEFRDGVFYVDLAPITHPDVVPVTAARALGLPDQPGRSTMDTLLRFIRDRHMLIVLDNCEHLIEASATLVAEILAAAPALAVLATSREPLGVTGEATWQVPSLSLADDAVELFTDRARLVRADFAITDQNAGVAAEICHRLDGMPLAIELAAARVRALSLTEIVNGLHDRFRLLTGGSRTAVRRQQTLYASVDWSHALLTETERILFRRLAVFMGGFDLDAAEAVGGGDDIERYQILDQLSLLVDKSLVVAENTSGRTRYRLLETVRQYALAKLSESGEADGIRVRHRDHYASMAALLDTPGRTDYEQRVEQAEVEMDNLRSAFGWSLENADIEHALELASSLQPLWLTRGRIIEGCAWFDTVGTEDGDHLEVAAPTLARALADKAMLTLFVDDSVAYAQRALVIARELDDPALLVRVLTTCCARAGSSYDTEAAQAYYTEAIGLARAIGDQWRLSQILAWQANSAVNLGNPVAAQESAEEGYRLASAIGDRFDARHCRDSLAMACLMRGDLASAVSGFAAVTAECEAAHDDLIKVIGLMGLGITHAYRGEVAAARNVADIALQVAPDLGEYFLGMGSVVSAAAALAAGDVAAARVASEAAWRYLSVVQPELAVAQRAFNAVEVALASDDLEEARSLADEVIAMAAGWHRVAAFLARARVKRAQGAREESELDAHEALACAKNSGVHLHTPDVLEVLADLSRDADNQRAARLFSAADACRQRRGQVRFKVHQAGYEASVAAVREAMDQNEFGDAWAQGAAQSTDEAIGYAQRGRGERKRASSGWESLTPAELDVVRLVTEGLSNKDIAARLFLSPRTVQAHLTHVYTKLGLGSRVQLAQEAARRG